MSEAKQNREQTLFEAASQKLDAEERRAFLDEACRDDPVLRARLELLLEGHSQGKGILTKTPSDPTIHNSLPATEKPGEKTGHHKLLQQNSEGGCGVAHMAEQQEPVKCRLVVRILKLGMDTRQVIARFETEREPIAQKSRGAFREGTNSPMVKKAALPGENV